MLSREALIELEPLLKEEGLLGGAVFYEYRTDDARLTIEERERGTAVVLDLPIPR